MATPINELKSYTEYNVTTPTSVFTIGFEYTHNVDHINVYVDGVPAATAGYTIKHDSHGTLELHPAVPSGIVLLQRETNIDGMLHTFSAGAKFIAGNMDEDFKQLRHAQQEVRDEATRTSEQFAILDANATAALDAANAAVSTANSIDAKATTALATSDTAISTANSANSTANTALSTANGIDAKATTALNNSSTALTNANTALSTANGVDAKATQAQSDAASALAFANSAIPLTQKGVASGVATLDTNTLIPTTQLPQSTTTNRGAIEIATSTEVMNGTDNIRAVTPSTLVYGIKSYLNAAGTAPMYACRAWVNFNGTGTVAIRASGNVSSITDNGNGNYTINLTTAMPDTNFAVVTSMGSSGAIPTNSENDYKMFSYIASSSSIRTIAVNDADMYFDFSSIYVAVFG